MSMSVEDFEVVKEESLGSSSLLVTHFLILLVLFYQWLSTGVISNLGQCVQILPIKSYNWLTLF